MRTAKRNLKQEQLAHWRALPRCPDGALLPLMQPIPYKAEGSRYGSCGIRIDGSAAFIDAVLSRLSDLTKGEGIMTRLELARHTVDGGAFGKEYSNAVSNPEVCYVRLHQRGGEGAHLQAFIAMSRARGGDQEAVRQLQEAAC